MQVTAWVSEATNVLRAAVGADAFAAAFSSARAAINSAKTKRKQAVALQAALDPEAAAQRRLRKSEKKGRERKRKAAEEKVLRDAGVRPRGPSKRQRRVAAAAGD